jgi:hypothetical protein
VSQLPLVALNLKPVAQTQLQEDVPLPENTPFVQEPKQQYPFLNVGLVPVQFIQLPVLQSILPVAELFVIPPPQAVPAVEVLQQPSVVFTKLG